MADDAGFTIAAIAGKGMGVRATRSYRKGDMILCEAALLTGSRNEGEAALEARFAALSPRDQSRVMALHDCHAAPGGTEEGGGKATKTVFGIMATNSLPLGIGADVSGLFPIISRFNHSCVANVHHSYNALLGMETVYANEDIAPGTEMCNCYISRLKYTDRNARQARLRGEFGFACACAACALPLGAARINSNRRRRQLADLDRSGARHLRDGDRAAAERDAARFVELLEAEGITDPSIRARAEFRAYKAARGGGRHAGARAWLAAAHASVLAAEGPASPATVKLKKLVDDPDESDASCSSSSSSSAGESSAATDEAEAAAAVAGVEDGDGDDLCCTVGCCKPARTTCSRCRARRYCSAACQRRDWKDGHRGACEVGLK